ncbi:MAG: hom [Fibrobacteres bacterium]|nr:hom [Fibrobacterota bacterium]
MPPFPPRYILPRGVSFAANPGMPLKARVGIIGLGTVGSGVLRLLAQQGGFFSSRLNIDLTVSAVSARSAESLDTAPAGAYRTTDPMEICARPDVDIVLELAGGCEGPLAWISAALRNGKHVVTANKALIAAHGPELFPLAAKYRRVLAFEGAVGGSIPIVKTLQESFVANDIDGMACIINGTCNHILTEMTDRKIPFLDALKEAQALGYAEADPTLDVEGMDAAHKLAILAALSYRKFVDYREMSVTGITQITPLDLELAGESGYAVKLLGVLEPGPDGNLFAHVYPALLAKGHPLASIHGVSNAVFVKGSAAGSHILSGPGAGGLPTASAVVGDLIHVCRQMGNNLFSEHTVNCMPREEKMQLVPIGALVSEYYLRFTLNDIPGAIGEIATLLARYGISINFALQKVLPGRAGVTILILTQKSRELDVRDALAKIHTFPFVAGKTQLLRIYR